MAAQSSAVFSVDLGALGSPSARLRAAAVEALGDDPRPEHLGSLFAALEDRSVYVRLRAVDALASLACAHHRPHGTIRRVLTRRMGEDRSADVKRRIAAALTRLAAPCPLAPLPPHSGVEASAAAAAPASAAAAARGKRRRPAQPSRQALGVELQQTLDDPYEWYGDYDDYHDYDTPPGPLPAADALRPVGEVETLVERWTARLHADAPASETPRLLHLLTPAAYGRLKGLVKPAPERQLPTEVASFARLHGLRFDPSEAPATVPGLALVAVARVHAVATLAPPDWPALEDALLGALRAAPPADEASREAIVLAFHEAAAHGPVDLRQALARGVWHDGWAPMACWLLSAEHGDWRERARLPRGSSLAQRCLREGAAQQHTLGDLVAWETWNGAGTTLDACRLLLAGGGSLRSLDYPEFRVMSRSALVELKPEQERELEALRAEVWGWRSQLNTPHAGVEALLRGLKPALWASLAVETRSALLDQLRRSALAYMSLRSDPAFTQVRLRRSHLVEFWQRPGPRSRAPGSLDHARNQTRDALALEGLALALLSELHQPWCDDEAQRASLKELLIEATRAVAACYAYEDLPWLRGGDVSSAAQLIDGLLRCFDHAPRELAQALGLDPQHGLPRLRGGQAGAVEQRFRRLHRESLRGRRKGSDDPGVVYVCRPLTKRQALQRGQLGRDCSSNSVPLRALSPHHVYYGIFDEQGQQMPGYLAVYEAWGCAADGSPRPVLCLETINEPRGLLAGVQQDLLVIFEAIARQRGLHPGLVLITDRGTWNYSNGTELARCRRARKGQPIFLAPADPVTWRIYEQVCSEARQYSAFGSLGNGELLRPRFSTSGQPSMLLLAPFDPALDPVQPENLAEARRLASLAPRSLLVTCRDQAGAAVGFVSG